MGTSEPPACARPGLGPGMAGFSLNVGVEQGSESRAESLQQDFKRDAVCPQERATRSRGACPPVLTCPSLPVRLLAPRVPSPLLVPSKLQPGQGRRNPGPLLQEGLRPPTAARGPTVLAVAPFSPPLPSPGQGQHLCPSITQHGARPDCLSVNP